MIDNKKVAIIGLGPAGVSCAIYLKRFGMDPVCFEKELVGGKVNKTEKIENYAGIVSIKGPQLGMTLEDQLAKFDIKPIYDEVKEVRLNEDGTFHVVYYSAEDDFRYVVLANGLGEKPFPIKGEETFSKRGISRCAICDGSFYKGKDVAVIGAGNSAFEEAIYLSDICSHVTLIARRNEYRAQEAVVRQFVSKNNTTVLSPYDVVEVKGSKNIESIVLKNKEDNSIREVAISGLFLYVGEKACSDFVKIDGIKDNNGVIITDSKTRTRVKNLFACGDCRDTDLRQVITATSDGALAANYIHEDYQKLN